MLEGLFAQKNPDDGSGFSLMQYKFHKNKLPQKQGGIRWKVSKYCKARDCDGGALVAMKMLILSFDNGARIATADIHYFNSRQNINVGSFAYLVCKTAHCDNNVFSRPD